MTRRVVGGRDFLALASGLVALVLAGCTGSASPSVAASASPSAPPAAPESSLPVPESPVGGLIVDIESESLADVRSITVETYENERVVFRVGELESPVPPGHLNEHMAGALPVLVFFRQEGGELVAYRIDDAPEDSPAPT